MAHILVVEDERQLAELVRRQLGFDRTVDSHMVRLRKKLGRLGDHVATVWGIGYKWRMD